MQKQRLLYINQGFSPLKTLLCLGHGSDKSSRFGGEVSEDVTLFGKTGLTSITGSMGEAPEDAYNTWETGLTSTIDFGEKSLKMSLYFEYRSDERCKLRGDVYE